MPEAGTDPTAVIVDGYSTANFLPPAFARLGLDVVHVQSTPELMAAMIPPDLSRYRANVVPARGGDLEATVTRLRQLHPVAVLTGQEPGVPLADLLSERMGLATNGSRLSSARRDKYLMIETLRAAGIRCAAQHTSADPEALVAWAEAQGRYPVVVKPRRSSSSDNVFICDGPAKVRAAARTVLASRDMYEGANDQALVQSYLSGTEYIVDTVSAAGRHYVCGVWEYEKTTTAEGHRIYDNDVLCDAGAAPVPDLVAYVGTVLDAFGIRHGPVHAEVIVTADGPVLVELGARLNGNMNPGFHDVCLGGNQADLDALAFARPGEFVARYGGGVYKRRQPAMVHNTVSGQEGVVERIDDEVVAEIRALPSVHLVNVRLAPGRRIGSTVDLMSSPLKIFMTAADDAQLRADHAAVQLLKDRVYRLAPPGGG